MYEAFYSFVALLVMVNPIEAAAGFTTLTAGRPPQEQARIALRATIVAACILLGFSYAGEALLRAMGVSMPAFKIAGGLLLLAVGFNMVLATSTKSSPQKSAQTSSTDSSDPSVFPLAIQMISGPGALTAGVTLLSRAHENRVLADITFIVIALVVFAITYITMRASVRIMKWLGPVGVDAAGRLVGIIVTAIAVQIVIDGVYGLIKAFPSLAS
jgi:multiple antibiotic resistance protein